MTKQMFTWFCEGRELHSSPDIQILSDEDLQTLVINEAFEDDTGRYTCVASNSTGADNTSAEVYIEGASSTDSEGEGGASKTRSGNMPQVQKKSTSMSLTIRSASPKTDAPPHRSTLVQALSQPPPRMQSPVSSLSAADVSGPPTFTKLLQDAQASEGQVVVLECRVRGGPPLQVRWYRQGEEIVDSPDFRVLQKKEICTLVISEAFPEDGGLFCCSASNRQGSVSSSARLQVSAAVEDPPSNGSGFEDLASFPPPPPATEISRMELPPKMPPPPGAFLSQAWPDVSSSEGEEGGGTIQYGQPIKTPEAPKATPPPPPPPPPPQVIDDAPPPPGKEGPPLPTKPKPKL
ncbi:Palladin [Dissostichus eleginoides]|uniref:Palladin n=1 Tax=Dissostichus eleginoides TaxID=100907 RepID=A0AAD9C7Z4_DISEL|nr:Palladin [Dissostichus eleginoides]